MQKQKINTFIIGAQKAGTTSLYNWLGQHPDIDAPKIIKDYNFFRNDNYFKKGYGYLESFYNQKSQIKLNAAVNYMFFDELCAKRIFEYNPQAKIIVCLREPIQRAISAYKYFVRTLREENSFHEALNRELKGELSTPEELGDNTYIKHGLYYDQIQTFLKYFPKKQIKFLFFEELTNQEKQNSLMVDILSFLEIDSDFKFSFVHLNASGYPKSKQLNYLIRKSQFSKAIKSLLPFRLRKGISKIVQQENISEKRIEVVINDADIQMLSEIYKEPNQKLKTIVNSKVIDDWL